jgi:hypothetical protein
MRVWVIILALSLVSCSYTAKLRRAERKIERLTIKYPELLKKDTVRVLDTLVIPQVQIDTVFSGWKFGDTLVLHDTLTDVKVRTVIDTFTVWQDVSRKADTIIKEIEVPIEKIVVQPEPWYMKYSRYGFWVLLILVIIAVLRRFLTF